MAQQKLYAGAKLREIRTKLALTQKLFAQKLGVSLPYLNQMENNNRPVSSGVLLALAQEFGFDIGQLATGDTERVVSDMKEALSDSIFAADMPPLADLRLAASNAPALAHAFLELHRAYRHTHERLASLDEALVREDSSSRPSPWEEVRDFFHYCDNYIDSIDRAAENFAIRSAADQDAWQLAVNTLNTLGISVAEVTQHQTRVYDATTQRLTLAAGLPGPTARFQLYHQLALLTHDDLLEATLDFAKFQTPEARAIAKIGLANYFAAAALMPYGEIQRVAQDTGHDLERMAVHFGTSIEQVAHRLSTLQRPGAKGIPFFFVRVDQAGTITKRHSAARLQFARFGGACPLWNVHQAFETPGRFLRQLAETPDGIKYFCLARDVTKPGGSFTAPVRRFAIGLGCEIEYADQLIYTRDMDIGKSAEFEPIGISCRICERTRCHQRSVPPLERHLIVDHNRRGVLPYSID